MPTKTLQLTLCWDLNLSLALTLMNKEEIPLGFTSLLVYGAIFTSQDSILVSHQLVKLTSYHLRPMISIFTSDKDQLFLIRTSFKLKLISAQALICRECQSIYTSLENHKDFHRQTSELKEFT
jgi:hypothetical protein